MAKKRDGLARASTLQAGEGYKCSCGFITDRRGTFTGHLMSANRKEPGEHESEGRCDMITGDITMPPTKDRTPEQLLETRYGVRNEEKLLIEGDAEVIEGSAPKKKTPAKKAPQATVRTTEVMANASQLRFVPRIYTIDYSPILRAAQEASSRLWGWRANMPLVNFIDTVIFNYFNDHGIILAGYIYDETEEEREMRERQVLEYLEQRGDDNGSGERLPTAEQELEESNRSPG